MAKHPLVPEADVPVDAESNNDAESGLDEAIPKSLGKRSIPAVLGRGLVGGHGCNLGAIARKTKRQAFYHGVVVYLPLESGAFSQSRDSFREFTTDKSTEIKQPWSNATHGRYKVMIRLIEMRFPAATVHCQNARDWARRMGLKSLDSSIPPAMMPPRDPRDGPVNAPLSGRHSWNVHTNLYMKISAEYAL